MDGSDEYYTFSCLSVIFVVACLRKSITGQFIPYPFFVFIFFCVVYYARVLFVFIRGTNYLPMEPPSNIFIGWACYT